MDMIIRVTASVLFSFAALELFAMIPGSMSTCEDAAVSSDRHQISCTVNDVAVKEFCLADQLAFRDDSPKVENKPPFTDSSGEFSPVWKIFIYLAEFSFLIFIFFISIYCCRRKGEKRV